MQDLSVNTTSVENVANFKYSAATVTNQSYIHEEIKSRARTSSDTDTVWAMTYKMN
jgi:hypothetical protein